MVQYNYLLYSFIVLFGASTILRWSLESTNTTYLKKHGRIIPKAFEGELDKNTLYKMTEYTLQSSRLESTEGILGDVAILALLLSGALNWLTQLIENHTHGPILNGILFFAILLVIRFIFEIPFNIYSTFVIEKKYEFSTITPKLWLSDQFKEMLISLVLMVLLLGPVLLLIYHVKSDWWLPAWIFFVSFQVFLLWIYPVLIIPIFYEYRPIEDKELETGIISLAEKAGIKVSGIYQINAEKRSRHTNAFFTGMGKTKRIVLYDTLLKSHARDEILSVLAHEIGHWKKRHVTKQALLIAITSLIVLYISNHLVNWPTMYSTFGLKQGLRYAGLFLAIMLLRPAAFFLTPIASSVSRCFEIQADSYSCHLMQSADPLIRALKKIAKENLTNLFPHPVFAWFYYSHPPITTRLKLLEEIGKVKR